jgi:hypothetical protein
MDPNNPTVALALALIARGVNFATSNEKNNNKILFQKLTAPLGTGSKFVYRAFAN